MMFDKMGSERKLVLASFVFLFCTFLVTGAFMEQTVLTTQFGGDKAFSGTSPVQVVQVSEAASNPQKLKAMIKGSIYETGSNMTVFGACFDGDAYLLPEASATFTAWYPNGTIHTGPNGTMDGIYDDFDGYHVNGTGRYKIHVTMGNTIGTYLTEIRCELDGEWAIAFGEWQNPEWVERIAATQSLLVNVSNDLTQFRNDTNNNFSDVLDAIGGINVSGDITVATEQIRELGDMVRAIDVNIWKLDNKNPFFVLGSGTHNYVAVDMLAPHAVGAVSSDGYLAFWDGETWGEAYQSGVEFRGVSVLPANVIYLWGVGTQGGTPVYSVNGANVSTFNLSGGGSPTAMNDIKIFQSPNDPDAEFYGYVVGDDGSVYYSVDSGATWAKVGDVGAASKGRISKVVENYDVNAQPNGYMALVGQGNTLLMHDGNTTTTYVLNGTIKDVDLLYHDLGYVVTEDGAVSHIYKFDGTTTLEYTIEDSGIEVTGIQANTQSDVWVSTRDPSTFYHFDGRRWDYSAVGYSDYVSVIITFGNASNVSNVGVNDISMFNSKWGYAVGGDGLILIYKQHYDDRLDDMLVNLTAQLDGLQVNLSGLDVNLTPVLDAIDNLTSITLSMNQSLHSEINDLDVLLQNMNSTMNLKLDNILSNVTYTNLYLTTTIYPLLDLTYQNTVDILIQLGIMEGKINQTLEITNTTLTIVNQTQGDVEELVNRSRRIRAWITQ